FPRFGVEQVSHFCIIQPSRIRQVFNPPMTNRKLPATAKAMVAELDPAPDLARAQQVVLELMAIPAKSGEEAPVAEYIRQKLLAAGAPADAIVTDNANKQALIKGNTGNFIFRLPGT